MSQYTPEQWRQYQARNKKGYRLYEAKRRAARKTVNKVRVFNGRVTVNFKKLLSI